MAVDDQEPRIAVFLDYENLAIGARDNLGHPFDFGPVADALAERGRVIVRKAYADWSYFDKDRRKLTRHQVELIELPQRMGTSRKNAADIKMAIDAIELALDREYLSTFVICTGDSDLSPLVQKLRELDRRVIGVGVRGSTSKLLPPACDEFMFYDNLVNVADDSTSDEDEDDDDDSSTARSEPGDVGLVLSTLAGLSDSSGAVRSSTLKRAVLRKNPTFSEADLGFRNFGSLLGSLRDEGLVELEGTGDPVVSLAASTAAEAADRLVRDLLDDVGEVKLSGFKTALKKRDAEFSERKLGYRNFGSFVRAAEARKLIKVVGKGDGQVVRAAGKR